MTNAEQESLVGIALKNNRDAMRLFFVLADASQVIDDYWDADQPVSREKMLSAIFSLAVDLPRNPFYQLLQDDVIRIIEDALCFWMQASDMEQFAKTQSELDAFRSLQVSYINRSVITDVLIKLARLVGGREHERAVAGEVRRAVYLNNEPFQDYLKEHRR